MYTRQEISQRRQEFWTAFGHYMAPIPSAENEKISWVNYKTGVKDIFFRMQADADEASIAIVLSHKDAVLRQLYFSQLRQVEKLFLNTVGESWVWEENSVDEFGRPISRILRKKGGLSFLKKEDWPALISFFKEGIIALDEFWTNVKYGFDSLH